MLRLAIGYPSSEVEAEILASHASGAPLDDIRPVSDARGVRDMIEEARRIHAAPAIRKYIVELVEATRRHSDVYLGASPRASIMILRAARALAAAEERDFVIPDDVKTLAPSALSHRIIVTADAIMSGRSAEVLVREIVTRSVHRGATLMFAAPRLAGVASPFREGPRDGLAAALIGQRPRV